MISEIFLYNLWANEKIASVLPETLADLETPSSFNSIRKTIYHVWDAESIWLKRIRGESLNDWPSKSFSGSFEEAKEHWLRHGRIFAQHVGSLDPSDHRKIIHYTNIKGEPYAEELIEILHHVANHSTFHRGQLVTMMRQLGHEGSLPQTDMIAYFRAKKTASGS